MDKMVYTSIILVLIPIYLMVVVIFRHYRQWLFYYLFAAFGFTLLATFLLKILGVDETLKSIEIFHTNLIGNLAGIPSQALSYDHLMIPTTWGWAILAIGIECSATLEMSALVGLLLFYPAFSPLQKLSKILFGLFATYIVNLMRMFIILAISYYAGMNYVFIAHAVIGRIFFFLFVVLIYWYLITKPTVFSVGNFLNSGRKMTGKTHLSEPGPTTQKTSWLGLLFFALILLLFGASFFRRDEFYQALIRGQILPKEARISQEQDQADADLTKVLAQDKEETFNYTPEVLGASSNVLSQDSADYLSTYVIKDRNNKWRCEFKDGQKIDVLIIHYLWLNTATEEKLISAKETKEGPSIIQGKEGEEWYCFASKSSEELEAIIKL